MLGSSFVLFALGSSVRGSSGVHLHFEIRSSCCAASVGVVPNEGDVLHLLRASSRFRSRSAQLPTLSIDPLSPDSVSGSVSHSSALPYMLPQHHCKPPCDSNTELRRRTESFHSVILAAPFLP